MEYRFLFANHIDRNQWDAVLAADPLAPVFAYSWYLDIAADNWGAIISVDNKTILPIAFRQKFGIRYIYQPFFTRSFGIYGGKDNQESPLIALNGLQDKFKYWDFCIEGISIPLIPKINSTLRIFQALDLHSPYEDLSKKYSSKLRRSLRNAKTEKLSILATRDLDNFTEKFKKYTSSRIGEFHQQDYERLKLLLEKCRENSESWHYAVQKDNQEISSAFFVKTGQRIIYMEGYSSPQGRDLRSMHLLFDYMIREHSGQNVIFDFGGSNVPSIAHFFRSFGAIDHEYYNIRMNNLPPLIRWLKK